MIALCESRFDRGFVISSRGVPVRLCALLSLLACLCLAAGCRRAETPVERGNRTQTLELGNLTEPTDLDPQVITSQQDFNIVFTLLEGLTTPDPKDLHPTPGAAQSWEISPDQTVYTFHLRPQAKWSDGTPVTAEDFIYSYRRMLSPKLGAEYSYMLHAVKNAEAYNRGTISDFGEVGFKATSPHAPDHSGPSRPVLPGPCREHLLVSGTPSGN